MEASLVAPERLDLLVDTCHPPEVTFRERDIDLQVKAMSISPSSKVDVDCQFMVAFDLQKPLGDRAIVDVNTGQVVSVTAAR